MDRMRNSLDNFLRTDTHENEGRCLCFTVSKHTSEREISSRIGEVNGGVAIICMEGNMFVSVNEHAVEMYPRNIVTFLCSDLFSVNHATDDFRGFVIVISKEYIINVDAHVSVTYFVHSRSKPMLTLPVDDMLLLETMCSRLESVTLNPDRPYFREIMQCVIMIVLYTLCGIYESLPHQQRSGHFRDEELFTEFLLLVEDNCRRERMLGFYAGRLSITPKHLSSSIKRISGHSAAEWIDYMVVQNIKRTLKTSSMTIQQVADYYNFPNSSFFGKFFKKHTGTTPRRFKAIH